MAKKEEVDMFVKLMEKNRPYHVFEEMEKYDTGMLAVLKYLNENEYAVKSKDINNALRLSSARMAVILKNLEKKGLIIKINSKLDARVISIQLSSYGKEVANTIKNNVRITTEKILDEFGIEYLNKLFEDMEKIKKIIKNHMEDLGGKYV